MSSKRTKESNGNLRINLKNIDASIANAIRRSCIGYIKCFAFSEFNIIENTSPIINEYLTNRIQFIPINSKKVKGNEKYSINKQANGNNLEVLSDDIKPNEGIMKNILITTLKGEPQKNEKIHIEMSIKEGSFQENASFDTCLVMYKKISESEYILELETRHKKPLEEIYQESIEIIINILEGYSNKMEITEIEGMFSIVIQNEDETLGNLLKNYILKVFNPEFVGFIRPHPLEHKILLKIRPNKDQNVRSMLKKATEGLIAIFQKLK